MNNEETIVMKPQNNKAEQPQSVETVDKKSNKGKKVVSTAAASIVGGVVGVVLLMLLRKCSIARKRQRSRSLRKKL